MGGHRGDRAEPVRLHIIIHFPWNPAAQKFAGEKIYFDRFGLEEQLKPRQRIVQGHSDLPLQNSLRLHSVHRLNAGSMPSASCDHAGC